MKKTDFYYDLPAELIAQHPLEARDSSRLLILPAPRAQNEAIPQSFEERRFRDLPNLLRTGDCLVLNDTKVIPARLLGVKKATGAAAEVLLLKRQDLHTWEALVRPGRKLREGAEIEFIPGRLSARVAETLSDGRRLVYFDFNGIWEEVLDEAGQMPLPPYIHEQLQDKNRYQTVYAHYEGSAAAPTAGLHFTETLLQNIRDKGIDLAYLTLHVGLGTFRPVKEENIEDHTMHSEYFELDEDCADKINNCKVRGGRVIAVGTTSCRVLETVADEAGRVKAADGWTQIYIYPGYQFRCLDGLVTNFHLPESTLIMLVSALAGRERILAAYNFAVRNRFRFFSFGDAMFIEKNPWLSSDCRECEWMREI